MKEKILAVATLALMSLFVCLGFTQAQTPLINNAKQIADGIIPATKFTPALQAQISSATALIPVVYQLGVSTKANATAISNEASARSAADYAIGASTAATNAIVYDLGVSTGIIIDNLSATEAIVYDLGISTGGLGSSLGLAFGEIADLSVSTASLESAKANKAGDTFTGLMIFESSVTASRVEWADGSISTSANDGSLPGLTMLTGEVTATGPGSAVATITNGAVDSNKLAAGSVINSKIENGAVDTNKLAVDSVVGSKILDGTIDTAKLNADIQAKLAGGGAGITDLTGDVTATGPGVVGATISAGAVDSNKLAAGAVINSKIENGAVDTGKLAVDSVVGSKILNSTIDTAKLNQDIQNQLTQIGVIPANLTVDTITATQMFRMQKSTPSSYTPLVNDVFTLGSLEVNGRFGMQFFPPAQGGVGGILKLGMQMSGEGDPFNRPSDGIVVLDPTINKSSRIKANRFAINSGHDASQIWYRADTDKIMLSTGPTANLTTFRVNALDGKAGFGKSPTAYQIDASSGIHASSATFDGEVRASTFIAVGSAFIVGDSILTANSLSLGAGGAIFLDSLTGEISATTLSGDGSNITSVAIAPGSIDSTKIAAGAVDSTKLAPGAISAASIAPGSIDSTKLANGSVSNMALASEAVDHFKIGPEQVYASNILTGAVDSNKLAAGSVINSKIANGAVDTGKLAVDSVVGSKILDGTIDTAKLNSDIQAKLAGGGAGITELTGDVTATGSGSVSATIAPGAVDSTKLAAGSVDSTKIAADSVGPIALRNEAVDQFKIGPQAVINSKIMNGAVDSNKLAAGSVINSKIENEAVDATKMSNDSVSKRGLFSKSKAGLNGTTPTAVGQMYYCTDCNNAVHVVVSTGMAQADFDSFTGGVAWGD